jgi:phospholipid/cholesterol/gamma-HCH transport system substrate-binding protein
MMLSRDKTAMGAFVVGGLLLFGFGLFLIGDRRMLFSRSAEFYTEFAQISALESGAKVRVGGMDAGEVVEVRVPPGPGSKFRVKLRIIEKLFPVIRTDSVASIQTDGLLGNKFLLIDIGTTGMASAGYTLNSKEPFEIGDLLAKIRETVDAIDGTVGEVKGDVTDATQTVADTVRHVDQIIVAAQQPLEKITAAAARISEDAGALIARVRAGEGTIGKLMNDDSVYNDVARSARQIKETMENLRATSSDVQQLVSKLKSGGVPDNLERIAKNLGDSSDRLRVMVSSFQPTSGGADGIASDFRATLTSAREAMSDLSENLEALKHGFFFRGFFKDRGFYDLGSLSPAEYQSKQFEKNVTKESAWVEQDELFIVKADGFEELSDPGRKKLDAAMATFLQYTKDRAVIVEGYAAAGTVDEQFLVSRDRATKVRDYLVKKFALSPDYIGVMPMGAAGQHGDGIALVLLKK